MLCFVLFNVQRDSLAALKKPLCLDEQSLNYLRILLCPYTKKNNEITFKKQNQVLFQQFEMNQHQIVLLHEK